MEATAIYQKKNATVFSIKVEKIYTYQDPHLRLVAALNTLESLSLIKKTSQPVFFSNFYQSTKKEDVLRALDDIKRFHPIILESRTKKAKRLQKRVNSVLTAYNCVIENQQKPFLGWMNKILNLFTKHSKLPTFCSLSTMTASRESMKLFKKKSCHLAQFFHFKEKNLIPVSEREIDVFRMKAISLIKQESGLFPSLKETMQHVHKMPIYVTSQSNRKNHMTLEQTLTPFPGETIIIRGSFTRHSKGVVPTTPLKDSFQLIRESAQTGFPYPSQHNGFALSSSLIPPYPLREDCLEELKTLLKKRTVLLNKLGKKISF